jgi:hypothetical protein
MHSEDEKKLSFDCFTDFFNGFRLAKEHYSEE